MRLFGWFRAAATVWCGYCHTEFKSFREYELHPCVNRKPPEPEPERQTLWSTGRSSCDASEPSGPRVPA